VVANPESTGMGTGTIGTLTGWLGFPPAEPYTNFAEGQQAGRRAQADETNLLHEETAAVKGAEAKRKNSSNR